MTIYIGVVGHMFPAIYNVPDAKDKLVEAFGVITSGYPAGHKFTVVLNYLGKGVCLQACELAKQRGWGTWCIASSEAHMIRPSCTVNSSKVVGSKFGDEIPELVKTCDAMIRIGTNEHSQKVICEFKQQVGGKVYEYDLPRFL